jgi:hypothetical protein
MKQPAVQLRKFGSTRLTLAWGASPGFGQLLVTRLRRLDRVGQNPLLVGKSGPLYPRQS